MLVNWFSVEVIANHQPLPEMDHPDGVFVIANQGEPFGVRLTNRTGRRVLAELLVNGESAIEGNVRDGFVLYPYGKMTVTDQRTASGASSPFVFRHSGVIQCNFYRELGPTTDHTILCGGVLQSPYVFRCEQEPAAQIVLNYGPTNMLLEASA